MGIILWIIFGALAGWIASLMMKSDGEQGAIMNIVLGVLGAVAGGFIANMMGFAGVTGFNVYSLIIATFGAVLLIGLKRAIA